MDHGHHISRQDLIKISRDMSDERNIRKIIMGKDATFHEIKVRTAESTTSDVYVNVNDLIIELMLEAEKADTQAEKQCIKNLIAKLVRRRNESHKSQV